MRKCYWLTRWEANPKENSIQPWGIELIEGKREGNIMSLAAHLPDIKIGDPCIIMTYCDLDIENQLQSLGLKRISRNIEKVKKLALTKLRPYIQKTFSLIPEED